MVDKIEQQLAEKQWLSGNEPGDADKEALTSLGNNVPKVTTHPNAFAWYSLACHFTWAKEILSNAAPVVQQQAAPQKEAKPQQQQKKEQPAQQEKKAAKTPDTPAAAEGEAGGEEKKGKKADKKAEREALKKARRDENAAKLAKQNEYVKDPNDPCADKFGDVEMNCSQHDPEIRFTKKYVDIKDIDVKTAGKEVRLRGRVHNSRLKGKNCFLVIRDGYDTIQCVLFVGDEPKISQGMVKYSGKISRESIVELVGVPIKPDQAISGCSNEMELQVHEIWTLNKSAPVLPFQIEDASRQVLNQKLEDAGPAEESKDGGPKMPVVKQDVRLNSRIIDLRVPTNKAIFKLQSGVCQIYREFFLAKDFIEIHSPKLGAGGAEGGCEVFKLKYFEQDACLAQSPQLYKQMALCADLKRVIEIGPVFRAENSNTNRHLCEFTGLDMEMEFKDHYFETLDLLGEMMVYLCKNLKERHAKELEVICEQYPFEEFKIKEPIVKLSFKEGVALLKKKGFKQEDLADLSTENEKALGAIMKEMHDTDFYILYGFPTAARAFYSMPDPKDPNYSNSYDLFMRGEEITSGAQRIHDTELLIKQAKTKGIAIETIKDYVEAFKYGVPNHAGAGFGLERIVKFFCNLHNIRKASLFPRDPVRLTP